MPSERRLALWRRPLRKAVIALALVTPFAAMPFLGRAFVDRWAVRAGSALALKVESVLWARPPDADGAPLAPEPPPLPDVPQSRGRRGAPSSRTAPHRGILVRADAVARAVASGMRPSAAAVPASGPRPAGIVLHGVNAFQVGLRDGDVLTSAGGIPATSASAVVAAVSGAVRSGAKAIGGVVWRGDQPIPVTVQIPDRPRRDRAPVSGESGRRTRPPPQ